MQFRRQTDAPTPIHIQIEYLKHKQKETKDDSWKCPNFLNVQCAMTPTMTAKRIFCLHRKQNKLHPPVLQTEQRLAFSKREESVNCN